MEELVSVLNDILIELRDMNDKLDKIKGSGLYDLQDIYSKLDEIQGTGSLSDIGDEIEKVRGGLIGKDLSDVCDLLSDLKE